MFGLLGAGPQTTSLILQKLPNFALVVQSRDFDPVVFIAIHYPSPLKQLSKVPTNSLQILAQDNLSILIADLITEGGNAIASVHPSVRLFPLCLRNRLTFDLEFLHVSSS